MTDLLLSLSQSALASKFVKRAGIPIPLPPVLQRERASWKHRTLEGKTIAVVTCEGLLQAQQPPSGCINIRKLLEEAGAVVTDARGLELDGIYIDARGAKDFSGLASFFESMKTLVRQLGASGRVLVINERLDGQSQIKDPVVWTTQGAILGFVKSLAKELGKRGGTANLVGADEAADLSGVVRYFLSHHSSFVSGQEILLESPLLQPAQFERLLANQTYLVTGAAQGIGAAISRRIAAEGGKVIILDRPSEMKSMEDLAREIHGTIVPYDLLKSQDHDPLLRRLKELAPLQGVIHNAGITRDRSLVNMAMESWNDVVALNCDVPMRMTLRMLSKDFDFMLAKDASLLFLGSISGIAGNSGQTNYSLSKAGLMRFVSCLALSHEFKGKRFNCLAPGFIETRMTEAMPSSLRHIGRRFNSLNQAGDVDDVAQAAVFMLSGASAGVNGQTLRICGQNFLGA